MLPKIDHPTHLIEIPSTKKKTRFRPFLVKEEKILLMAKESDDTSDILSAIKQIIANCSIDQSFDIDALAIFDLEYIFLKLRAISVDNTVKVSYRDTEDQSLHEFEVDLNKINVSESKNKDNVVKINNTTGLIMRYPPATIYDDKEFMNLTEDYMFELIVRCIESIYSGEELFESSELDRSEIREFLNNLDTKTFENIQNFLINSPKIEYKIQYKNKLGNDREIVLSSLNDFFTWR